MRCIVVLMSQSSSSATTEDLSVTSTSNREPMLAGFPWVSAIILYTLSWGWSLLRPNTLYWDDWDAYFLRSPFYYRGVLIDSGRPLWEGIIEGILIQIGVWTICLTTFLCYFLTSIFIFGILKKLPKIKIEYSKLKIKIDPYYKTKYARVKNIDSQPKKFNIKSENT